MTSCAMLCSGSFSTFSARVSTSSTKPFSALAARPETALVPTA